MFHLEYYQSKIKYILLILAFILIAAIVIVAYLTNWEMKRETTDQETAFNSQEKEKSNQDNLRKSITAPSEGEPPSPETLQSLTAPTKETKEKSNPILQETIDSLSAYSK